MFIDSYISTSYILSCTLCVLYFFFFNDTATTEIYTLSLHDALPISDGNWALQLDQPSRRSLDGTNASVSDHRGPRSEEHTSELQSRLHLVCRLLLEKKKKKQQTNNHLR